MKKICYDASCDTEKLSCFVDCNSMITNIQFLIEIHKLINSYKIPTDRATGELVFKFNKDFQTVFVKLCNDYIAEFNQIADENNFEKIENETESKQ